MNIWHLAAWKSTFFQVSTQYPCHSMLMKAKELHFLFPNPYLMDRYFQLFVLYGNLLFLSSTMYCAVGVCATLMWSRRMRIALDAAKGLAFLHGAERPIIYRDFKTSNILLDAVSCLFHDVLFFRDPFWLVLCLWSSSVSFVNKRP